MLSTNTSTLQKLSSLYLFGQPELPSAEKAFDIKKHYDKNELDELELNSSEPISPSKHPIFHLNCDWDTVPGSMRNSTASIFDAVFSSLGSKISQNMSFTTKLGFTLTTFLSSMLANDVKVPLLSNKLSIFNFAGRLIRSPLHIFDSIFSVIGESWSESAIGNGLGLGLGLLGFRNTIKNPDDFKDNDELDYQTLNGTLGRSAIHHLHSLSASFAQNIYKQSSILGLAMTGAMTVIGFSLPKSIKNQNISWKSINGLLSQNLFHFVDSLYSGFGALATKLLLKSRVLSLSFVPALMALGHLKAFDKLAYKKLNYTEFNSKLIRSTLHTLDTVVFNLGTEFSKSKLAMPFLLAYSALGLAVTGEKPILPGFKIPMNNTKGLLQRLPFDFVESIVSATSNNLSKKIPAPLLTLVGPAISFKIGEYFKSSKTQFNDSNGLILKHLIHFWDNLLTSSGYRLGDSLMGMISSKKADDYSGSIMSDGRWMTSDGRILPRMVLGKQMDGALKSS